MAATASRRLAGGERQPQPLNLLGGRAEGARSHELVLREGHVEDGREVHVDADLAQLEAGRSPLEQGGLAVVVLRDRVRGKLGRQGRGARRSALLVDRHRSRGLPSRAAVCRRFNSAASRSPAMSEGGNRTTPPISPARACVRRSSVARPSMRTMTLCPATRATGRGGSQNPGSAMTFRRRRHGLRAGCPRPPRAPRRPPGRSDAFVPRGSWSPA